MRIPNIYTLAELVAHTHVSLGEKEAQHLVKVLRMKTGFKLKLFNGDGYLYDAEITAVEKKSLQVQLGDRHDVATESRLNTHIGQVMSRGDRMDYAIQKATEMGVSEITPLFSERCEVKLDEQRLAKRLSHWQQVAISACEQCGRAVVPKIHAPQNLDAWLSNHRPQDDQTVSLVLHHRDQQHLSKISNQPDSVNLLIGPEGGLTESEIKTAMETGFISTTLGPRVLRTETAPVAALAVIQWLWGDYS